MKEFGTFREKYTTKQMQNLPQIPEDLLTSIADLEGSENSINTLYRKNGNIVFTLRKDKFPSDILESVLGKGECYVLLFAREIIAQEGIEGTGDRNYITIEIIQPNELRAKLNLLKDQNPINADLEAECKSNIKVTNANTKLFDIP